jgi:hypothetical protein
MIRLEDLQARGCQVVLAAALALFTPADPVEIALVLDGVDEVHDGDAVAVMEACDALADGALPEIVLLGETEARGRTYVLTLEGAVDPRRAARAVTLLTAMAQQLWDGSAAPVHAPVPVASAVAAGSVTSAVGGRALTGGLPAAAADGRSLYVAQARARRAEAEAARILRDVGSLVAGGTTAPHVVVLVQHKNYWGALQTVIEELASRDDVRFSLVTIDSYTDKRPGATAAFVAEQGWSSHDEAWLVANLDDVDILFVDNPYDDTRPDALAAPALAARGIRLVYVPYANNTGKGDLLATYLYDLPLHHVAWRIYTRSEGQNAIYGRDCAVGSGQTRALGSSKVDRVLRPVPSVATAELLRKTKGRTVFLWNPHFRVGEEEGWSTFAEYLAPLVQHFLAHPELVLVVRPHFLLFGRLQMLGGALAKAEGALRRAAANAGNIVLDESPDYLVSFAVSDAMISDLSSLVTEYLPTGKPLLYLAAADGPGLNDDSGYYDALDRADDWSDIERFITAVAAGRDGSRDRRLAAIDEHFGVLDGRAGARMVEAALEDLRSERAALLPATAPLAVTA